MSSKSFAATYYVANTGSDSSAGTASSPFLTIQRCLNVVKAGDTCYINAGTYNEALTLITSGTSTAPITIQSAPGATVTINSGASHAIVTKGACHYYIFDGLRIVSTHTTWGTGYNGDYSIDFSSGVWSGANDPTGGNNGFIVRNCYIEGAILIYGHNISVYNCTLNGTSLWGNAVQEMYGSSHDNVYRDNTVYGYTTRAFWSMSYTNNVLIQNNTIHDIGVCAIDLDGAGYPDYNGIVRGNTIYNVQGAAGFGIQFENGFNCVAEKNTIYNVSRSLSAMNYGGATSNGVEYRTTDTNNIFRNNIVYTSGQAGVYFETSPGNRLYNNTFYNTTLPSGYFAAITLANGGTTFPCNNTYIKNNIIANTSSYAVWIEGAPTGLQLSNNLYYNANGKTTLYYFSTGQTYTLSQFQSAYAQEAGSLYASPLFVNAAGNDFHLQSGSPAIDKGTTITAVTDDFEGTARPQGTGYDIGAYEYHTTQTSALAPPANLTVQ